MAFQDVFFGLNPITAAPYALFNVAQGKSAFGSVGRTLGFGRGPSGPSFDINAELSRISGLFEQQRQAALQGVQQQFQQARGQVASNLATRGILRSPVSENVFGQLRRERGQAEAQVLGDIASAEAQTRAKALGSFLGFQFDTNRLQAQQRAQRTGLFSSIGTSLLLAGLTRNPAFLAQAAPQLLGQRQAQGGGFGGFNPFSPNGPQQQFFTT